MEPDIWDSPQNILVLLAHPDALVVRTSLLVGGPGHEASKHELAVLDPDMTFYEDEIRCPAQVGDFASALLELVALGVGGVLHVAGVRGPLAENFPASETIEVMLSRDGFERLVRYIHDAYDRAGAPVVAPLGPGLYGDSRFYPARESFNIFRTCNVWTARALRAAGVPVRDAITMAVQVNGKLRGTIEVAVDIGKDEAQRLALAEPGVARFLEGQSVRKVIVVPGKIVNIVAG